MAEVAFDKGKKDMKNEVQVIVASVKDEKDKAEPGKSGPNRILRYAEVWVLVLKWRACL